MSVQTKNLVKFSNNNPVANTNKDTTGKLSSRTVSKSVYSLDSKPFSVAEICSYVAAGIFVAGVFVTVGLFTGGIIPVLGFYAACGLLAVGISPAMIFAEMRARID